MQCNSNIFVPCCCFLYGSYYICCGINKKSTIELVPGVTPVLGFNHIETIRVRVTSVSKNPCKSVISTFQHLRTTPSQKWISSGPTQQHQKGQLLHIRWYIHSIRSTSNVGCKDWMYNKKNNTQDSNVVPHRSTNWARRCLTSQSERDAVLSSLYGRSCSCTENFNYIFAIFVIIYRSS